jgi:hypothetical protein
MSSHKVKQKKLLTQQHQDLLSQLSSQKEIITDITNTQRTQLQELNIMSNLIGRQQEQIKNRDTAINQLADQLLHLQQQVILLEKIQKKDTTIINEKIDTKKCIELTTNMGRQHQKQMEIYQNDLHDITSQLSKLDSTQKENSSLILTKIDTHSCMEIINNKEQSCQARIQNHEVETKNSILNVMASQEKNKVYKPQTSKIKKNHRRPALNDTSILIANIKSKQNPNIVTHALFYEFQVPQICLANSQSYWTKKGKLRVVLKNPSSADWIREAISYQMRTKFLQGGHVSFMFQRCHILQKFNIKNQHAEKTEMKESKDEMGQQSTILRMPEQINNEQIDGQPPKIFKNSGEVMLTELY